MANENGATAGSANSNNSNDEHKPESIKLGKFRAFYTAAQRIEQTARYAKHPRKYLEELVGPDVLEERKHLLCIPEPDEIDNDMYGVGKHKAHFEEHIARLFGKESALFFVTGIQAQMSAFKIYCQHAGKNRVAWHVSAHPESAEERSFEKLFGFERVSVGSNPKENPIVEEIKEVLSLPENERPVVILIELPNRALGCKTYTFSDLETISANCRAAGVKFHCDGARLWEVEPYYQKTAGKTFADIARLFDSLYVSFYKGLAGIAGAMLIGDTQLIREAKEWQRRAGGNLVTSMCEIIDSQRGFNENIGVFERRWNKMNEIQTQILEATKEFKAKDGEKILSFAADPSTCCQVQTVFTGYTAEELKAAMHEVEKKTNVRVFERTRQKQTVDEIVQAAREGTTETNGSNVNEDEDDRVHEVEWMIAEESEKIDTKIFVDSYVALCEELLAADKK